MKKPITMLGLCLGLAGCPDTGVCKNHIRDIQVDPSTATITWSGDEAREIQFYAEDDSYFWRVQCDDETALCLSSPYAFPSVPSGASPDEESEAVLPPGAELLVGVGTYIDQQDSYCTEHSDPFTVE